MLEAVQGAYLKLSQSGCGAKNPGPTISWAGSCCVDWACAVVRAMWHTLEADAFMLVWRITVLIPREKGWEDIFDASPIGEREAYSMGQPERMHAWREKRWNDVIAYNNNA